MKDLPLRIGRVGQDAEAKDWLQAKRRAHEGDPAFVVPLDILERRRIARTTNPFFQRGEAVFFVAMRGGRPIGRVSAQIVHDDQPLLDAATGLFGFFDVADDLQAGLALIEQARAWLRSKGVRRLRGPFNLTINEECGCQIDAFDVPPAYLMPQSRPWTAGFLEEAGLAKAIDLHAWRVAPSALSNKVERIGAVAAEFGSVRARPIRKDRFDEEIKLLADIFNDAWSENWGFLSLKPADVEALASELRLIYRASYGYFVELDGEPVGVLIGLPNINEAIAGFDGRLTPFKAVKLAARLFGEGVRSSRIPLAGLRRRHQSGLVGSVLTAALAQAALSECRRRPVDWFEFSWVLETNEPARRYLAAIGASPTITYRLFEGAA